MTARRIISWPALALGLACMFVAPLASAQKPGGKPAKGSTAKPAKSAPKTTAKPTAKDPGKTEGSSGKPGKTDPGRTTTAHQVVERESRIEFDERMVRGQSAAGAIYLFQRSPSDFKSIVNVPETFRPRTVALLTPRKGTL